MGIEGFVGIAVAAIFVIVISLLIIKGISYWILRDIIKELRDIVKEVQLNNKLMEDCFKNME